MPKFLNIPRIIAIAIIIAAILAKYTKINGWILLLIIGIIIFIAPKTNTQKNLDRIKKTIQNWQTILKTALIDGLFWITILATIAIYGKIIGNKIAGINLQSLQTMNPENLIIIKETLTLFITGLIVALIIGFIGYYVSRLFIWKIITKQKLTKQYALKYLAMDAIWWTIWLIPIIIFSMASAQTKSYILITIIFIIAAYFTGILHPIYNKTHKLNAVGNSLGYGISKIHLFIIPYAYAAIIYAITSQALRLLPKEISMPINIIYVIIFISWLRTYINEIADFT